LKTGLLIFISLVFSFGVFEIYFSLKQFKIVKSFNLTYTDGYKTIDDFGNPAYQKNFICNSIKTRNDLLIYDAIYTIDENGLRISPKLNKDSSLNIIFLGGSFTFGDGLMDQETLPSKFEILEKGKYSTYNFGLSGTGAYHMLNYVIKSGKLENILEGKKPHVAVFTSLGVHVMREPANKNTLKWYRIFYKSNIFQLMFNPNCFDSNIKKYVNTIVKIKNILKEKYNTQFIVLLWEYSSRSEYHIKFSNQKKLLHEFNKNNIKPILVEEEIFSNYNDPITIYHIKGIDHPSAIANDRIAKYLSKIIKETE
jgi:hypothetical protein